MRSVRDAARDHPGPRTLHIEKLYILFPPWLVFFLQCGQAFATVFGVALHEFQPGLVRWQRWRTHVDPEHVAEPQVFADALVDHLFMHAASAGIVWPWPEG